MESDDYEQTRRTLVNELARITDALQKGVRIDAGQYEELKKLLASPSPGPVTPTQLQYAYESLLRPELRRLPAKRT